MPEILAARPGTSRQSSPNNSSPVLTATTCASARLGVPGNARARSQASGCTPALRRRRRARTRSGSTLNSRKRPKSSVRRFAPPETRRRRLAHDGHRVDRHGGVFNRIAVLVRRPVRSWSTRTAARDLIRSTVCPVNHADSPARIGRTPLPRHSIVAKPAFRAVIM